MIVCMLAGSAVVLVDLGFVWRWIWVRSATVVCRNEVSRCLFSFDLRLLCFPLSPPSAASFRASPSCSNGLGRNDESEELVGTSHLFQVATAMASFGGVIGFPFLLPTSSARV